MKIEDQLSTREQSKRLKSFGIIGDGLFWHYQNKTPTSRNMHYYGWKQEDMPWGISITGRPGRISGNQVFKEYQAFSVAELGVMLPKGYSSGKAGSSDWHCFTDDGHFSMYHNTEAQARCAELIWGIDNVLIGFKISEINERIKDNE